MKAHLALWLGLALGAAAHAQEKTFQLAGEGAQTGTVDVRVHIAAPASADARRTGTAASAPAAASPAAPAIPLIGGASHAASAVAVPGAAPAAAAASAAEPRPTAAVPVAVYTTMKQASAAGVNPLRPAASAPQAASAQTAASRAPTGEALLDKLARVPAAGWLTALAALALLVAAGLRKHRN